MECWTVIVDWSGRMDWNCGLEWDGMVEWNSTLVISIGDTLYKDHLLTKTTVTSL